MKPFSYNIARHMLTYPSIDPVIFSIGPFGSVGPFDVRWYGVTYVIAFALCWWLGRKRASQPGSTWKPTDIDDIIFYGALGAILGGRLGWVLFYGFERLVEEPTMIFKVWQGGMSFHGGLLGVMIAEAIVARRQGHRMADMYDFAVALPGLGILSVRIANFINGELWGKPTTAPWGFLVEPDKLHPIQRQEALNLCERFGVSPCVLQLHATQLYEGLLEGLVLFVIVWIYTSKPRPRYAPTGLFLICYGVARFAVEFLRVPDENRGYILFGWLTMGQILTMPMIVIGIALMVIAYRRNEPSGNFDPSKRLAVSG
jgi:phosphatidylglycerol:prolipoprotein diacylglycerol transferase